MLDIFALVFGPCFTSQSLCGVLKTNISGNLNRYVLLRSPGHLSSSIQGCSSRGSSQIGIRPCFYPLPSCAESRRKQGREDAYIWTTLRGQKEHQLVITKELKRNFDEFGVLASLKSMNFKQFLFVLSFVTGF